MATRDPLETLRQMREFALEASELADNGSREQLDRSLAYRRQGAESAKGRGEFQEKNVTHLGDV